MIPKKITLRANLATAPSFLTDKVNFQVMTIKLKYRNKSNVNRSILENICTFFSNWQLAMSKQPQDLGSESAKIGKDQQRSAKIRKDQQKFAKISKDQ